MHENAFSVVTVNERSLRGQGIGTMSFRLIKKLAEGLRCDSIYGFRRPLEYFETEEEIPWTLDGEFGGVHEEVVVKDCQKALEIMVKPEVIEDVSEKKGTE